MSILFDEAAFEGYGFAVTAVAPTSGAGHVDRLRIYRRTQFLDQVLVTGSIQKPFEEQLYLDADLIHCFKEQLYLAATPVKPFTESFYLAGAVDIMEWLYPELEKQE